MYQRVPPPKNAEHNLPTWQSLRPESSLEKAHEAMAHYGNSGMAPALVDTLLLAGVCKSNVKQRWQCRVNSLRQEGTEPDVPLHFAHLPPFWDHSACAEVNRRYEILDLSKPFEFVTPIREDNGEVFGSEYFKQQGVRNGSCRFHKKTHLCNCNDCLPFAANAIATPMQEDHNSAPPLLDSPTPEQPQPAINPPIAPTDTYQALSLIHI